MKDKYYTVKEFAKITRYHPGSIHRFLTNGVIKGTRNKADGKLGNWRIPESEVEKLLGGS